MIVIQIIPKIWSYMSPEERNHFVESVKENTYKLHVQGTGTVAELRAKLKL